MERVAFNSEYPTILGKHLWCASVESGIEADERKLRQRFGDAAPQLLRFLEQRGDVTRREHAHVDGAHLPLFAEAWW
jgi:DEAD/DEAH box helicase domain-containing protein